MFKHILFVLLILSGTYYYWTTKPITHGPGIVAPDAPEQQTTRNLKTFQFKDYRLVPKANITMTVRVLSIKNYYFDNFTGLTPVDVVFGWGPMSDEENLKNVMVRQSDRSFHWEMANPPLRQQEMWRHAANMHLILPNPEIEEKVYQLREGHIVEIEGLLVNAESNQGWELKTSLERKDLGSNSSELLWIKNLTIL